MQKYICELADSLGPDVTLGPTDAAICAAALRLFAAATEAVTAVQAAAADLLALTADAAMPSA